MLRSSIFFRKLIEDFSDRPIDLSVYTRKTGVHKIFGSLENRLDGTSLFQLLSWNMDAVSAACTNLRFLSKLQDPAKVTKAFQSFLLKIVFLDCIFRVFMLDLVLNEMVIHVLLRSTLA